MNWIGLVQIVFVGMIGIAASAQATVYHVGPTDDWLGVVSGDQLKPGDEVVLADGVYRDRRRLVLGHRGTEQAPIVIHAAHPGRATLHRPDARQNSINIVGAQYLVLRGLEITGGSAGIRMMKSDIHPCKFVTIEQMHIHHIGGVAITANSPGNVYQGLVFRLNHIHHTAGHGEGFYLGVNNNPDGSTAGYIFDCLVERNYIHHLKGPEVSQGDGIEIKDGSYQNIVRDNVIHDTNYPGVIVYGTDGRAPNVIERNAIWNSGDHGIQAAAEAIIRNNIIFDNQGDGIHSHHHQSAEVGGLRILHNTIVVRKTNSAGISISQFGPSQPPAPVEIANNAIYVPDRQFALRLPTAVSDDDILTVVGNVGRGATIGPRNLTAPGRGGENAPFDPRGQLATDLNANFYPRPGSALLGTAHPRFRVPDDFLGTPRADSATLVPTCFATPTALVGCLKGASKSRCGLPKPHLNG